MTYQKRIEELKKEWKQEVKEFANKEIETYLKTKGTLNPDFRKILLAEVDRRKMKPFVFR